tara:strand:+ start:90 stop:260 length:171 start_codon:yes stop_codon:yes gene_type:complete
MTREEVLRIIHQMKESIRTLERVAEKLSEDPDLRKEVMDDRLKQELINDYYDRSFA